MDQQNVPPFNQQFDNSIPPNNSHQSQVKNILIIILILTVVGLSAYVFLKSKTSPRIEEEIGTTQKTINQDQSAINAVYNEFKEYEASLTPDQKITFNTIAQDRSIGTTSTSSYEYVQVFGYKFKTPWGIGTISANTKNSEYMKQLEFKNGKKLLVLCLDQSPRQAFTTPDPVSGEIFPKEDVDQILSFLGSRADSGFDYTNLLLSSTIEDVKKQTSVDAALGLSKILTLKSISLAFEKQPYRFVSGNIKGFQSGDYKVKQSTFVQIFPTNSMKCDIRATEASNLSQKDVDVIITTFTKI